MDNKKLSELEAFLKLLDQQPELLHLPELKFFRNFLERHGATVPPPPAGTSSASRPSTVPKTPQADMADAEMSEDDTAGGSTSTPPHPEMSVSADEADTEEEEEGGSGVAGEEEDPERMNPEAETPMPLSGRSVEDELSDSDYEKIADLKSQAAECSEEGNFLKAAELLTEAIQIATPSALMYCRRAEALLKAKRPMSCIADCNEALRINPDYGKAYRLRGKANRYLGNWQQAHTDLSAAQRIDYDEGVDEMFKFVESKYQKLAERERAQRRRREERALRNKMRARRRAQAAARKAYEAANKQESEEEDFSMPNFGAAGGAGGMPNFGNMGGAGGKMPPNFPMGGEGSGAAGGFPGGLAGLLGGLGGPGVKEALNNPRVLKAVLELMQNPASFAKYQNDPEVMKAFESLRNVMGGAGPASGGAATV